MKEKKMSKLIATSLGGAPGWIEVAFLEMGNVGGRHL